jgi:replicative DNA helicase
MNAQPEFMSIDAEQQLLGAILTNNERFAAVGDVLKGEHFGDPVHRRIYEIAAARIGKGHIASPVTMRTVMEADEGLKMLGGPAYLVRMAGAAVSSSAIRDYSDQIIGHAARRALRESAQEALQALSMGGEPQEVQMALLTALQSLPEARGAATSVSFLKAMMGAVQDAADTYHSRKTFLKTGIPLLDGIVRGLAPGDLMLLAGSTSMGKSATALEIASNVAIKDGKPVAFASLEMSEDQLATRLAACRARVPYSALRDAQDMPEREFQRWVTAANEIANAPISIIQRHVRDLPALQAAAMRVKSIHGGLSLFVVDYAQLIRAPGKGRYEQMTEVSIGLKAIAGRLGCPVIALCQLSRDIGNRDDKKPQLSDIKETGQFENDADQVVFCHREEYWLNRQGPKPDKNGKVTDQAKDEWNADMAANKSRMELLVRKNRHGKLGAVKVGFDAATNRFWDLSEPQYDL